MKLTLLIFFKNLAECLLEFGNQEVPKRQSMYDLSRLGIPRVAREFDAAITTAVAQSPILNNLNSTVHWQKVPLDQCSDVLSQTVLNIAAKQLKTGMKVKKNVKHLQERRDLFKHVHENHRVRRIDSMRHYNKLSDFPAQQRQLVHDLVQSSRAYERAKKETERSAAEEALQKMCRTSHINVRLDLCFKFLRARKRSCTASCPSVTHQILEVELSKLDHGPIPTIALTDHIPMSSPPSLSEFGAALLTSRTGISPGTNQMHPEFYHASPALQKLTAKIMFASYVQSRSPSSWSQTTVVLIPKCAKPKTLHDLRPITLSQVEYKAFARVLLSRLQDLVGEIKPYQSGFLSNRSCDDQNFAQQRVLETEWNHKRAVYMLSLDFKQAFSSVNLHKLDEVLTAKSVPRYFINLIIDTCLSEETSFIWMGTATSSQRKTIGVKQGCTIAPFLFVLVLDVILERTQKELEERHQLNLFLGEADREIELPTLFAYADDLNVFGHSLAQLDTIMTVTIPIMREYGLELNSQKCHLVRKSPVSLAMTSTSTTVCLGGLDIPIQRTMTVLGSTYSEDMCRKNMILARCTKAIRLFYAMRKHLVRCQLSFDILVRLYKVVIAPVLLFGLRSVSITKGNQMILVRRELHILKSLSQLAYPPANDAEVYKVLRGRTINRRLTVSRLVYHGHVKRAAAHGLLQKALSYRLNLNRKVGRPLFTYDKTIQNELENLMKVIDHDEWLAALNNREKLKKLCEKIYDERDYPGDPMPASTMLSDQMFGHLAR